MLKRSGLLKCSESCEKYVYPKTRAMSLPKKQTTIFVIDNDKGCIQLVTIVDPLAFS